MTHTTHDGPPAASFCAVTDGRSLQLADLSLYYEVLGGGASTPLVVLNGGPGVDHTYMHCSDVWDRLAAGRAVLLYDPRGTGRSSRLAHGPSCTYRDQIDDLAALLDHLGWGQVDLLGHSFGGNIAMAFVARHGERVRRLALVDSGAPKDIDKHMLFDQVYPEGTEQRTAFDFAETWGDDDALRASFMIYFAMLFYSPERRAAYMARASADGMIRTVNESLWADVKRYDLWPELAKLRLPTLVVTGRFDANIAPAVAYHIHKAVTGSRFVVFEQSGHLPFYEEPDAFLEVVTSFLS
jgi:proline iminopeptidase